MSNYGVFAEYYDRLTQNIEYEVRSDYISGFFNYDKPEEFKVLDIACGTGTIAEILHNKGFDVTGIDLSEEMLAVASSKSLSKLFCCDMRHFDFNQEFDACISTLDSLNHLEGIDDWELCFKSAYKSLKNEGLFIFDVNTVYKHNHVLENNAFIFDEEDFFLAWDNELLESNKVRILLDFFIYNGESYDRYSEEFYELAYTVEEITERLDKYFKIINIYDDMTFDEPKDNSERLYFICKRK